MIEVGSVCMKNTGREAGRYCVVVKKINSSFVFATGPKLLTGVKRRRANVDHLNATEYKIEIKEDATDEEVIAAMEKLNLITKLKLKRPSAAQMKEQNKKQKAKDEAKSQQTASAETKKESAKDKNKK